MKLLQGGDGLQRAFDAAYKAMVGVIEEGRRRFKGSEKDKLQMRLAEARQLSVKTYQRSEFNLQRPFRATAKEVCEKEHPGRIKRQSRLACAIVKKAASPLR